MSIERGEHPVAVVGAGSIGVAWAIVFARAGHPVRVWDVDPVRRALVVGEVSERAGELAGHGLLDDPRSLVERVSVVDTLADAVEAAVHVQECVVESEEVKRGLFVELDDLTPHETVLASSSSMMPVSRFVSDLPGRARCLIAHPGNPPYLLPVVELVPSASTSAETVDRTEALMLGAGMNPVRVHQEVEGFLFNRLQGAVLREAYRLVRDGVASAADVDRVVSHGLGRRWSVLGPFATADLNTRGGIRRHAEVMGPAYLRMGAEHGEVEVWPSQLVDRVADSLREEHDPDDWAEDVLRRDRALMRLAVDSRAPTDH